ncbi:hypothetical protein C475_05280 [Halosimplex carlsbadense 2-9-1]|uniref:DUF7968 domain-containing protein n=1 Tax=Halosimplex carlsbadense 2-9-1 TaxID=797114 RepID=M0CY83_9EURY|nr:hypothetical protein [Halosimplex carlsbadense]ELZ28191.1 hypothetical protein C475_05280 [Halosimplex carlsbadense 2-9-1]
MTADATADGVAQRVVVRYAPVTGRITEELETPRYGAYLRRAEAGPVATGDEWGHFVSRGCGATADVTLTVEAVEGGDRVGETTEFEFAPATEADEDASATGDGG